MRFFFSVAIILVLSLVFSVQKGWIIITPKATQDFEQTKEKLKVWYQREQEEKIEKPAKEKLEKSLGGVREFYDQSLDQLLEIYQEIFGDPLKKKPPKSE